MRDIIGVQFLRNYFAQGILVNVKVLLVKKQLERSAKMPFIRNRCIWWEPVEEASSYVVYASTDQSVFAPGNFKWEATKGIVFREITDGTKLIVPEDWPEFPSKPGTYYIGITSKDEVGNQSDPFVSSGLFRFSPPAAPSRGGVSETC
jgi:hypothetical protein